VLQNWNHLSQEVIEADTINAFKSRLENSTRFGTKKLMLLNPTASSSSSSSKLLQECPSVRVVCLSHSWAVLKQLDWIEMPFRNARRLALANSMPYCVRWGPDLHPPAPGEGAISVGKIRPIVKCGHNAWQCRRSQWQNDLINSIQTWHNPSAWPPVVSYGRPM